MRLGLRRLPNPSTHVYGACFAKADGLLLRDTLFESTKINNQLRASSSYSTSNLKVAKLLSLLLIERSAWYKPDLNRILPPST